jgi:signal peptidase I
MHAWWWDDALLFHHQATVAGRKSSVPARQSFRKALLALLAMVVVAAAGGAGLAWHSGYRIYVVHTGSMTPALRPGDAVLDRPAPHAVHSGEIITFAVHSGPDNVVTHRVASVSAGIVKTKGDANRSIDPWGVRMSQVVGSSQATLPYVGYVVVYLKQPRGIASIGTLITGFLLLWQLFFPAAAAGGARNRARRAVHKRRRSPSFLST